MNTTSLFEETTKRRATRSAKPDKLSAAQLRELEAQKEQEVAQGFHRVKSSWSRMLAGEEEAEREWLVEAEKLVETFRETRNLFNATRVSNEVWIAEAQIDAFFTAAWISRNVPQKLAKADHGD